MTSTSNETSTTHETAVRPGNVTIYDRPEDGRARYLYVIAALPGRDVFGVDLGTYLHPTTMPDLVFATGPVTGGDYVTSLGNTSEALRGALATFLVGAGLPDPTGPDTSPEGLESARREGAAEVQRRWDEWKDEATRVAHEYADNNSLCSEFDRCMEEIGLEPRGPITYRVTYTIAVPRGTDPWDYDMEDLYNEAEDGTYRPSNVERVD